MTTTPSPRFVSEILFIPVWGWVGFVTDLDNHKRVGFAPGDEDTPKAAIEETVKGVMDALQDNPSYFDKFTQDGPGQTALYVAAGGANG